MTLDQNDVLLFPNVRLIWKPFLVNFVPTIFFSPMFSKNMLGNNSFLFRKKWNFFLIFSLIRSIKLNKNLFEKVFYIMMTMMMITITMKKHLIDIYFFHCLWMMVVCFIEFWGGGFFFVLENWMNEWNLSRKNIENWKTKRKNEKFWQFLFFDWLSRPCFFFGGGDGGFYHCSRIPLPPETNI